MVELKRIRFFIKYYTQKEDIIVLFIGYHSIIHGLQSVDVAINRDVGLSSSESKVGIRL